MEKQPTGGYRGPFGFITDCLQRGRYEKALREALQRANTTPRNGSTDPDHPSVRMHPDDIKRLRAIAGPP